MDPSPPARTRVRGRSDGTGAPRRRTADAARVTEVMTRVAGGESAAVFVLHEECRPSIEGAVRRALRHYGVDRIDPDDLEGLVVDCVIAIGEAAGSWQPDRALPWWWAYRRIRQVVGGNLGQFGVAYDPDLHGQPDDHPPDHWTGEDDRMLDALEGLAQHVPAAALLFEAFRRIPGSARDREVLLHYVVQQAGGDQSPAETVGRMFGLAPATVRQAVKRTRDRLRALASRDPQFAAMLEFALVA